MNTALIIALWTMAALTVLGALVTISAIGKPRKPTTHATAITTIIFGSVQTAILVLAAITIATR